jgi:hypothetical protein
VTIVGQRTLTAERDLQRVRPEEAAAGRLIREGLSKSPTFRALVDRLQHSDVIVYVRLRMDMPDRTGGSLKFLAKSASDRFVLVSINRNQSWPMLIALLGHELQHAVEVADAPGVTGEDTLQTLYRTIGVRMGRDAYDSEAAQRTGWIVRAELMHRSTETRLARHAPAGEDLLLQGHSIESAAP